MLHTLKCFIRYFLYAVDDHSLHSPLVYDFYKKVIKAKKEPHPKIEQLRENLKNQFFEIEVEDFGTGAGRSPERKVNHILKVAVSKPEKAIMLREIARFFKAEYIIELGTSLGLTSMYFASVENAQVVTFEGSKKLSSLAQRHFNICDFNNIKIITGNIDLTFSKFLDKSDNVDLFYFDANHRYKPTMEYYKTARRKAHQSTVFIFDDIYYSPEMEKAWKEIRQKTEVTLSIDLFRIGIVLFDPTLNKKHYTLSFF